jgi:DNA-binding response OmpR family regulator
MKKILIVEDEEDFRKILKSVIIKSGFECFDAGDGRQALKILKENRPDLAILDLILPDITGEQICKEIRKNKETSSMPVIMLTAKDSDVDRIIGRVVGADIYMKKPCDISILFDNIRKLLQLKDKDTK